MKVFSPEAHALIEQMAQARREARDNGPRVSNDHLEAAMVLAMVDRLISVRAAQESTPPVDEPPPGEPSQELVPIAAAPAAEEPPPPAPVEPAPAPASASLLPPIEYAEGDEASG